MKDGESPPGSIWVISGFPDVENLKTEKLNIENWPAEIAFQPHGIDIHYVSKQLYVVNHAMKKGGERIEVLEVKTDKNDIPNGLKYLYTITSDELNKKAYGILNSVAIIEPNKFYVTRFLIEPHAPWGNPGNV